MSIYASTTLSFGNVSREFYFRKKSTDEAVMQQIFVQKNYNMAHLARVAELKNFLLQRTAAGLRPLVVDAGANIGASAVYFQGNIADALVVAVEPDRENWQLLQKNVAGLAVEPIRGAISSSAGRAQVVDPGEGYWAYRTRPADETAADAVPCVTINDIFASHTAGFFPFIVKVDIEGAEADLFASNTEWVARTPVLIVELHDWMFPKAGTALPFLQCVSKLNRDFLHMGEDVWSIAHDLDAMAAN
jgi:FkbM family methyltransferase